MSESRVVRIRIASWMPEKDTHILENAPHHSLLSEQKLIHWAGGMLRITRRGDGP